jgi:thioredoxin
MAEAIAHLSDSTFDEEIGSSATPVLVDFWAEWCGPCKMIAPILEEIADENGDTIKIAKLNVDEAPEIARRFEVMSIPTMILFKDGQEAKRLIGAKPKQALLDDVAEFL